MHPFFLLLLTLLIPHEIVSGTTAATLCNRWCGDTTVPYTFGFSDGCPIALSCDADTSTPTLSYTGGSGTSYRVVSFNSTISTVMVSLPVSCIRSVPDVRRALSGANYGVSARTMLSVRGCHNASASSCIIPAGVISRLLDTARCDGSDASVKCVASVAPNASAGLAYRQFLRWENVERANCDDVLASGVCLDMVDGVLSLANEVAELAWWLNGTCVVGGGGCAANATCSYVNTPSGSVGRCTCVAGMNGDGFLAGDRCYVAPRLSHHRHGTRIISVVALASALYSASVLDRDTVACFFAHQDIKFGPKNTAKPPVERLSSGHPVQSESEKTLTRVEEDLLNVRPRAIVSFTYLTIRFAAILKGESQVLAVSDSVVSTTPWEPVLVHIELCQVCKHKMVCFCFQTQEVASCILPLPEHHEGTYDIVLGVGSALLYLHQETEQRVVHRDIKPSNIMLDASFIAKLGDFGLARLINDGRKSHTTGIAGTMGYIDPESLLAGRASVESDVASGQRPALVQEDGDVVHLVQWVWDLYGKGSILDAADERLKGEFDSTEMERVMVVGLWCAHPDRAMRPSIRQALNVLRSEAPLPSLPDRMPVATYGPPTNHSSSGTLALSSVSGR
ncbi:hypothetical protein VPH35_088252 [Triticum aestivum]